MRRVTAALLCAAGFVCACLACALTGLEVVFLDPARYTALQDELNVYEDVGISREEQILINADLAGYLAGKQDSLERPVTLRGEQARCAFNARELAHMEDVRALFDGGRRLRAALAACAAGLLALGLLFGDRRAWGAGLLAALILVSAAAITAFLLLRTADFSRLFIRFHQLAFSNDLWLLNPETDAMIRMLPDGFFDRMALSGGLGALCGGQAAFAAGALPLLLRRPRRGRSV